MYGFVNFTWNPINGACQHDCDYCYMKVFKPHPLHLNEKILNEDLGKGNFIFVGSSTDMFAVTVPREWILKVLNKINANPENKYLLQSKNPKRFAELTSEIISSRSRNNIILCTTIESNRHYAISNAPSVIGRAGEMEKICWARKMLTAEPIMNFDLEPFVEMIKRTEPEQVNIGYDTKGHHLPEPGLEKTLKLIEELEKNNIKVFRKTLRKAWDEK